MAVVGDRSNGRTDELSMHNVDITVILSVLTPADYEERSRHYGSDAGVKAEGARDGQRYKATP